MNRIITVKGTGNVKVKPDLIVITLSLESLHLDYSKTMKLAAEAVEELQKAIGSVGFDRTELKTTNFNISTHYESYRDRDNNYKSKFDGYLCEQGLKLEFDFDNEIMSKVLTSISKVKSEPRLNIQFSVKDKDAVNEALLVNATNNAKRKAEILAKASDVLLGDLLSIEYDWGELHLYSQTRYAMEDQMMKLSESSAPSIEPEDIEVSDTVSFVWEIR